MLTLPPDDLPPDSLPPAPKYVSAFQQEKTAESFLLWGAQSERRLPCKPEFIDVSLGSAWQQPYGQEDIGEPTCTTMFHSLLQKLELQYRLDLQSSRLDLEKQLRGLLDTEKQCENNVDSKWQVTAKPAESNCGVTEARCQTDYPSGQPSIALDEHVGSTEFERHISGLSSDSGNLQKRLSWIETSDAMVKDTAREKINRAQTHVSTSQKVVRWMSALSTENKVSTIRLVASKVVNNAKFDLVCVGAIILNASILGVTTDIAAKNADPDGVPKAFEYIDRFFVAWFFMELSLRIIAGGCTFFFGENRSWNLFDLLVVSGDLLQTCLSLLSGESGRLQLKVLRMLRVIRIVRALRIIKLFHFFKELRMMVFSVLRSGLSLLWSMMLLVVIIFIFSVYLTQVSTLHIHDSLEDKAVNDELKKYFGSLRMAGYVLFQCISGGINWGEVGMPLLEVHWSNGLVLSFYVFFTVFAVLNIITGIFVDTALNSAQADRDEVIHEAIQDENSTVCQLEHFFMEADVDKSGCITFEELTEHLKNHKVRAHLMSLGIEVDDATGLFHLLDLDKSGEITVEEFIFGCLKMKGLARSIDVASLIHENRRLKAQINQFFKFVKQRLKKSEAFEEQMKGFLGLGPGCPTSMPMQKMDRYIGGTLASNKDAKIAM